uniref:Phosphoribosylaminoimidazole carboxylase n=1 Tax=Leptobrachium leishanense TaxID=445787 RepID=A0A8C5LZ31_9ANUR
MNPIQVTFNMERGAGRYWTEDEIRALLSVWSEKNIKKQLRGTLRNKGLFMYVAKRLQHLGVFRDWKQCRAKYKNLKYEYRAIKCGNVTGDGSKMRFYDELDAILGADTVAALTENEESSLNLEAAGPVVPPVHVEGVPESHGQDFCAATESDDMPENGKHPFNSGTTRLCTEGGKHWTTEEIKALITVWYDHDIRKQLKGTVRNRRIFEHIARLLQNVGVDRDWRQCRTKYKNLKHEYIVTKRALESGDSSKTMKFFYILDDIMQNKVTEVPNAAHKTDNVSVNEASATDTQITDLNAESGEEDLNILNNCLDDGECLSNLSKAGGIHCVKKEVDETAQFQEETEQNSFTTTNLTENNMKTEASGGNHDSREGSENDFKIITINDTGAGRNWSDHEVRTLLNVWSDERICRQLEGTFRNRELFEEISQKMMEFGVSRDWKQCRTKYKNLKYEYYGLRKDRNRNSEKNMKFYDEIDSIIRRMPRMSKVKGNTLSGRRSAVTGQFPRNHIYMQEITDVQIRVNNKEDQRYGLKLKRKVPTRTAHPCKKKHSEYAGTCDADDKQTAENNVTQHNIYQHVNGNPLPGDSQHLHATSTKGPSSSSSSHRRDMEASAELKLGKKLNEGKTKEVYELLDHSGCVLMQSKDQITAGNAARKDHMEGKASISNKTTSCIFKLLQEAGIKTAFVKKSSDTGFIATHCEMIPIEWVCRRIATGSFLKRNPGVKEGYKFSPPKIEIFFKDDANNDPQWSEEQLIAAKLNCAGLVIGQAEVDIMNHSTVAIFEILEKAWSTQDCTLVDMKIEFGVDVTKKEIVLADVIDNDSWRLWPSGDKTQQKDKQSYRDLKEITPEAMQMVKRNFEWVADRVELLLASQSQGRVVVLMGSISDLAHCEKIKKSCANYGIPCELRVTSAHKGPDETLRIKAEYEGDAIPTVFIAVAGRSNGLGPVLSGNTPYPVINCPPLTADWGAQDVWSSLRMPSGLGCSTVLSPEAAAQFTAQIFGLNNHLVWSKLRSGTLNTWISLKQADSKLRACSI